MCMHQYSGHDTLRAKSMQDNHHMYHLLSESLEGHTDFVFLYQRYLLSVLVDIVYVNELGTE